MARSRRALSGDNLILAAAEAAKTLKPGVKLGHFRLLKELPVAAGLGGGSADAACALRLIARANGGKLAEADLVTLARDLGSDVSVCLGSEPSLIAGRGEKVVAVRGFPTCAVLLANPRIPLATAPVYAALRAAELSAPPEPVKVLDFGRDFETSGRLSPAARQRSRTACRGACTGDQGGARRSQRASWRAHRQAVGKRPDLLRSVRHL